MTPNNNNNETSSLSSASVPSDTHHQQQQPPAFDRSNDPLSNNNNNNSSVSFHVSSGSNHDADQPLRHRTPFVSSHRQVLNRIKTDSTESRPYRVPHHDDLERRSHHHNSNNNNYDYNNNRDNTATTTATRGRVTRLVENWMKTLRAHHQDKTPSQWLETFLPMWSWLKTYNVKTSLGNDLVAGLTVGVMIIPQSMSYAKLAGLPVEYGLYSALVPVYAYSFFGSSRQLAVGPVALISLLLSTGLSLILEDEEGFSPTENPVEYQERYNQLAVQTSFLVGVMYIIMGLCRLGFVTIFLSHAVISGFTTGAAVVIGMSQIKYIFGYDVKRSDRLHEIIQHVLEEINHFKWQTFLMGTLSIAALLFLKNIGKTYPKLKWLRAVGPLAVTTITIVLTVVLGLEDKGIPIVGDIPKGLPSVTISDWTPLGDINKLFVVVGSITIVGFMESISIAKQLASKHKYEIDSSLELIGLGMSNFLGGMFNAYPVTGSFSRSAVNNESGAQSGISAIVTATMVGFTLLFLTFVFEQMPLCVLAAVVISGVIGLLDYEEAIYLWRVHRFDFMVWFVACAGTMFLGVEIGLAIAVAVSLLIVLYESAYPHTSVMGRLPGTTVYRNIKQYPEAERYDGLVLMRIDAPLYFANAQNVRDKIRKYRLQAEAELEARSPGSRVKYLVLDISPVSHIDTSALHILEDMNVNYCSRGQQICYSNPSLLVMERFVSSGLADKIGREHFFTSLHDAVNWCLHEMDCEATSVHESTHDLRVSTDLESGSNSNGSGGEVPSSVEPTA